MDGKDILKRENISHLKNNRLNRAIFGGRFVDRNHAYLVKSQKNKVNLNAWVTPRYQYQNVGDYLSFEIVKMVCDMNGIDMDCDVQKTKHLYAIGSVLMGYKYATIWGSGFGYDNSEKRSFKFNAFLHRCMHGVDVRAVRGPETKRILNKMGYSCNEVYGDPAVLLPLFYNKPCTAKKRYVLIPHYSKFEKYNENSNVLSTFTKNWKAFVDRILESQLVISSSLHGLIIAEAYGIPAIMLKDTPCEDITKYKDWYFSTGRYDFPVVDCVEEALSGKVEILDRKIISEMQANLLNVFPYDLWKD